MKTSPIWESATRPLFVRSVWLESDGLINGHRHFILDYKPQSRRNSDFNVKPTKKDTFHQSLSYEFCEPELFEEDLDNLQLIGLQKTQFEANSRKTPRPSIFSSKKSSATQKSFLEVWRRNSGREHLKDNGPPSKQSSLQDIHSALSNMSNSNERLAERVLSWLDLAGKNPLIRPNTATESVLKKTATRGITNKKDNSANKLNSGSTAMRAKSSSAVVKRPDSVKHITIIFNKEGIPVRYNRPARYSDLFRSGYSSSRKYAGGSLAMSYTKIGDNLETVVSAPPGSSAFDRAALDLKKPTRIRPFSMRKHCDNDYRAIINRKILEESCNLREVKKQLHIFMPNLPKKVPVITTDDATSVVSTVVSDVKVASNTETNDQSSLL